MLLLNMISIDIKYFKLKELEKQQVHEGFLECPLKQLIKPSYECTLLIPRRRTSLVALMVKRLPTMWETRVQSLGWEDLLEKEMATYSSILAWKIPWMEEPGRLQSTGSQSPDTTEQFHFLSLKTEGHQEGILRNRPAVFPIYYTQFISFFFFFFFWSFLIFPQLSIIHQT